MSYVTRAVKAHYVGDANYHGWHNATASDVIMREDGNDHTPVYTGLVDANGVAIYRVRETVPFGFQPPRAKR